MATHFYFIGLVFVLSGCAVKQYSEYPTGEENIMQEKKTTIRQINHCREKNVITRRDTTTNEIISKHLAIYRCDALYPTLIRDRTIK